MSDGDAGADAATHGPDADDLGLTGTPPGSRGAAPWERFGTTTQACAVVKGGTGSSAMREPVEPAEPVAFENHGNGGSHADGGLTVADLIAKVGGPVAERPRHHHAAPDTGTAVPEPPLPSDEQDDNYDAYASLSPAEYNYDLPDLDAIHRELSIADADVVQTTVLPKTSVRPRPARLVEKPDVEDRKSTPLNSS